MVTPHEPDWPTEASLSAAEAEHLRMRDDDDFSGRGDAAEIPAESVVSFELRSPVTIQEKK